MGSVEAPGDVPGPLPAAGSRDDAAAPPLSFVDRAGRAIALRTYGDGPAVGFVVTENPGSEEMALAT